MNLWHNLHNECIAAKQQIDSKKDLLRKIASLAAKAPSLQTIGEEAIFKALEKRESLSSTGLTDGVAIPHCSFDSLKEFVVGTVITERPIDFKAMDDKPSQIFIFLIGPTGDRNTHVRLLSSISKSVKQKQVREALIDAGSPDTIKAIFRTSISYSEPSVSGQGKSQISLYIQNEDYFNDILEAVSSEADGSVTVIETENANNYLHRMPIFAALWNDRRNLFSRVIVAVVDREAVNSVLRRVQTIAPDLEHNRGVLVTVQDLSFALGAIDF